MATLCDVSGGNEVGWWCLYDSGRFQGGREVRMSDVLLMMIQAAQAQVGGESLRDCTEGGAIGWIGRRRNARWTLQVIPSKPTWSNQMLV